MFAATILIIVIAVHLSYKCDALINAFLSLPSSRIYLVTVKRISRHFCVKSDVNSGIDISQKGSLSQLKIKFNCDDIDSDELSEMIFELGPISVSVESIDEKDGILNDEKNWEDLQKTKSWATAMIRANFPTSFDIYKVLDSVHEMYPGLIEGEVIESVRDVDWVLEVQKNWKPQKIDDLIIRFPWHNEEDIDRSAIKHELVLEGGSAFG